MPIRLTAERWSHIVEEHAELAGLREEFSQRSPMPRRSLKALLANCWPCEPMAPGQRMIVVYREAGLRDGFFIAAFLTSQPDRIARRNQSWPRKK